MRLCIAQINTTPGDFFGNKARIVRGIRQADAANADLVVFPELTIPGYLSQDLLYNPDFIDRNLQTLQALQDESTGTREKLHIVVGYIGRNPHPGKPFTNMVAVLNHGEVVCTYQKQLLPFYDVFDELRYFEPGSSTTIFELLGHRIGLAICEDLWNDKGSDDYDDSRNPLAQYRAARVDILISLNSSPFVHRKCQQRLLAIAPATDGGPTVVYVNQRGGQDELVFDGQSFVVKDNRLLYLSQTVFEDTFDLVALDQPAEECPWVVRPSEPNSLEPLVINSPERRLQLNPQMKNRQIPLTDLLVLGLKDYVEKSGFRDLVLASSGGVDSAVVCKLACAAVGARHVHAVRMPSIYSSAHARDDARQLHENLGCWDYEIPVEHETLISLLTESCEIHSDPDNLVNKITAKGGYNPIADENIQARLRDLYLMHFSNAYGAMPLSTGNKTESGCGYYTHFDMNFSYAPIKDLYKFQVVAIARSDSRVPANIWQKAPSAELSQGQTDEQSLLPYAVLDPIVMAYIEDYVTSFERFALWVSTMNESDQEISGDPSRLVQWLALPEAQGDYSRIISLIGRMEYKRRQTCPGTKVSRVAFGIGRRVPIVEKWSYPPPGSVTKN